MICISSFPWKAWLLSILPYVSYLRFFLGVFYICEERKSVTDTFKWILRVNKDLHQQRLRIDFKRFIRQSQSRISIRWIRVWLKVHQTQERKTIAIEKHWPKDESGLQKRPELNTSLMPVAIRKIRTKLIGFSDLNCIRKNSHKTEKIHFSHT